MKRILLFVKKLKPNQKVFFDLLIILLVFGLLSSFYQSRYPSKKSYKGKDFFLNFTMDRKLYKENSIVNFNIDIRNRKKEKIVKLSEELDYSIRIMQGKKIIKEKYLFEKVKGKKIFFEKNEKKRYSMYIFLGENIGYYIGKGEYKAILILNGKKKLELPINVVEGD